VPLTIRGGGISICEKRRKDKSKMTGEKVGSHRME